MNKNDVDQIQDRINQIVREIKDILESHLNYRRIIILGVTGSGKSSLMCCLADKKPIIEKDAHFTQLVGEGIVPGCKGGTEKPIIFVDDEKKLLIIDSPGFEDVDGLTNEIVYAFADDYVVNSNEHDINLKIILVISCGEFDSRRGGNIIKTIDRMKRMFPNPEELRKGTAIVITKGLTEANGKDYFKKLNQKTENKISLKNFCDYYTQHENLVFCFPAAAVEDIGKIYDFEDHPRLVNFMTNDDVLYNPETKIAISRETTKELDIIRLQHLEQLNTILKELFLKIDENFREINDSETIGFWLKTMKQIMEKKISKIKDFQEIITEKIQNPEQYDEYFKKLDEYEAIDNFIDKVYYYDTISSYLQDSIRQLVFEANSKLQEMHKRVLKQEHLEILNKEKKEMLEQYQNGMNEQQKKIDQLILERDQSQKEQIEMLQEMKDQMDKQSKEYEEKIAKMQEEFFNQKNLESAFSKENQEILQALMKMVENQEKTIHYLANRPPVVVKKGGCLLI